MKFIILFVTLFFLFFYPIQTLAQTTQTSTNFEGEVVEVMEGDGQVKVKVDQLSEQIYAQTNNANSINSPKYKVGDKVVVAELEVGPGQKQFYVTDFVRKTPLLVLASIFAIMTLVVGRKKGVLSLLGLIFSFLIIFKFVLPAILQGDNPIFVVCLAVLFIIPVTFYLSHGISNKTHAAVLGTLLSLVITGVLAQVFVNVAHLSGFSAEEAGFLQAAKGELINIKGLLLAGIIISMLGILDDVTIAQSSLVFQLKKNNPKLNFFGLYHQALNVGKDHIASVVNTLVLVYTGASMPLLLLFIDNPHPFFEVINNEVVAEEIVRTLIASIGLILAVPLTTLISSRLAVGDKR